MFGKKGTLFLLAVLLFGLAACAPTQGSSTVAPSTVTVAPVPVPEAEMWEHQTGIEEIDALYEVCQEQGGTFGSEFQIKVCPAATGTTSESGNQELVVATLPLVALNPELISSVVGIVTSVGGRIVAFVVKAGPAIAAGSPYVFGTVLAVTSVVEFMKNPPTDAQSLELQTWLANRYVATGAIALTAEGVQDAVGLLPDISAQQVTETWSEVMRQFRVNGLTAIILEDDPLTATTTYHALRAIGFTVLGIFPTCEMWKTSGLVAQVYTVDNPMSGGMTAFECANHIYITHVTYKMPLMGIILHSVNSPASSSPSAQDVTNLRTSLSSRPSGGGTELAVGEARKKLYASELVWEIMRLFGG